MQYLIVGTGRSGTGFVKHLLGVNGISCGHETVFGLPHSKEAYLQKLKDIRLPAESSWMVVPFLDDILEAEPNIKLLHITRHPVKVIKSFLDLGILNHKNNPLYVQVIGPYVTGNTDIELLVSYYITWYKFLEQYDRLILDIDNFDYSKFSEFIGRTAIQDDSVVNRKSNQKARKRDEADVLNDITMSCRYEELQKICEKYGFIC